MKIAIVGCGGVGGYFGARLAQCGCEVIFIARGTHLATMREYGLKVESELGNIFLPKINVTDDPRTVGPVDLVLFSVKLWDTETAARSIVPLLGPNTGVVSFQNGVQKDEVLRHILGDHAVMSGVCYIAAAIAQPGVIKHTGTMQRLLFGESNGTRSVRIEAFLDACRRAKINAEFSADIQREMWKKFVFVVGLSATTATMRVPIGPIRSHPRARSFLLDVMKEAVAVGRAHGIALPEDFAENRLAFCDGLHEGTSSSLHHDLEHGNRLEVAWLSGGVVELGRVVSVPTPANRAVHDILALHA